MDTPDIAKPTLLLRITLFQKNKTEHGERSECKKDMMLVRKFNRKNQIPNLQ